MGAHTPRFAPSHVFPEGLSPSKRAKREKPREVIVTGNSSWSRVVKAYDSAQKYLGQNVHQYLEREKKKSQEGTKSGTGSYSRNVKNGTVSMS